MGLIDYVCVIFDVLDDGGTIFILNDVGILLIIGIISLLSIIWYPIRFIIEIAGYIVPYDKAMYNWAKSEGFYVIMLESKKIWISNKSILLLYKLST